MWNTSLHSNMNFPAPIAVLGFLAAGGGLTLVVVGIAVAPVTPADTSPELN